MLLRGIKPTNVCVGGDDCIKKKKPEMILLNDVPHTFASSRFLLEIQELD